VTGPPPATVCEVAAMPGLLPLAASRARMDTVRTRAVAADTPGSMGRAKRR
jgi:hypothetical protein